MRRNKFLPPQDDTSVVSIITSAASIIAASLRLPSLIVASAANSGLAALNLMCGSTLHKSFELPVVEGSEAIRSRLYPQSHQGIILANTFLILLDELPTTSISNYEAIDLMFQELMGSDAGEGLGVTRRAS